MELRDPLIVIKARGFFSIVPHFDQRVFFRQPNSSSSHYAGLIFTASNKKSFPWHKMAEILLGFRQGMVPVKF